MMKNVVRFFCITGAITALCTVNAWAVDDRHAPVFKFWVVGIYEEDGGNLVPKDCPGCPRQDLPAGAAIAGDFINVEVTIGGWDAFPDVGHCDGFHVTPEECSITAQDCTGKHCEVGGSSCDGDGDCLPGVACVDDVCIPYPLIGAWQWTIDSSTYYNDGGKMGLVPAEVPCVADSDCYCGYDPECHATAMPPVNNCTCSTAVCEAGTCDEQGIAYINESNSDYVFLNRGSIVAVRMYTLDYTYGGTILTDVEPVVGGEEYYVGTLLLQVTDFDPPEACGEFVIDMHVYGAFGAPSLTFAVDEASNTLPDAEVEPLTLNFMTAGDGQCGDGCHETPPECMMDWCNPCNNLCEFVNDNDATCPDDGNPCTDDYCDGGTCVHPNNTDPCDDGNCCTLDDQCSGGVCEGTEMECPEGQACNPSSCVCEDEVVCDWATAEPYPPQCAIDARQPNPVNNPAPGTPQGWDAITLTFSDVGCDTSFLGLTSADFTVRAVPPGDAPISIVDPVDADGQTVTVNLSRPISPLYWTCVTRDVSGGERWCLGYLPADVNGDRLSNTADIGALIDSINGVEGAVRPDYATDIDRSDLTNPSDILREIDLLNGAGDLGNWITKSLPACPEGD